MINCAVPGYNLTQLARAAEIQIEAVNPDLVVLAFFSNDLRQATPIDRMLAQNAVLAGLIEHSRLVRALYTAALVFSGDLDPPHLASDRVDPSLLHMENAAKKSNAGLMAVVLEAPHHPEIRLDETLQRRKWSSHQAPDLSDKRYRIDRNGHFNAAGHHAVASWLTPLLSARLKEGTP